ncbi:unnamed protein product, partial [Didymodactylos carnosus]
VVFGQQPRCDLEMWKILADSGIEDEEDLPADFAEQLNEHLNDNSVIDVPPACLNPTNHHKRIRDEAEENYLKTIEKRQNLYDAAAQRAAYVIGDLVGLKSDRVDRTNVTARILLCKIMSIQILS